MPEFRAEKYWPPSALGSLAGCQRSAVNHVQLPARSLARSRVPSTLCLRVEKRNATHANILRPSQISDKYFVQTATILCAAHVGRESWGSFAHNITRGRARARTQHFAVSRCAFRRCHKSRVVRHPAMRRCSPRSHACAFNTRARRTAGAHTHTHTREGSVRVRVLFVSGHNVVVVVAVVVVQGATKYTDGPVINFEIIKCLVGDECVCVWVFASRINKRAHTHKHTNRRSIEFVECARAPSMHGDMRR